MGTNYIFMEQVKTKITHTHTHMKNINQPNQLNAFRGREREQRCLGVAESADISDKISKIKTIVTTNKKGTKEQKHEGGGNPLY